MNIVNAEITKIALNSYVTMKISFANTLAEICEQFDGGNVEITSQAIGADSRVGTKYLKGALGFGGPCFPRDNTAFARMANDVGCNALLATATHEINDRQVARLSAKLASCVAPGSRIGVLGLAYKTGTPVVERSQGMEIAVELAQQGFEVTAFDSLAQPVAADFGSATVTVASSANACVVDCAAIVLALPEPG
ncbi:MAG: UDP binding domain-containing protein, partial [Alphaproteobacteria bacterium]